MEAQSWENRRKTRMALRRWFAALLASLLAVAGTPMSDWRRSGRRTRAMSAAHGVVLGIGIVILLFGLYLIVTVYYAPAPGVATLIVGLVLVVLGLAETLVESEGRKDGRK